MPSPLYLAGPTGCGKTAIALALARLVPPVEIVNGDAYQVYRGLDILSAAPTEDEQATCPHHLFGALAPSEENDAATFATRAKATLDEVGRRALPLVVGGSGLYLKAITHGLAPTPKGDAQLRAELDALPLEELVERYRTLDPEGAASTNLKNRRYVTRNLEICLLAGRPASELKREWAVSAPSIRAAYLHRERGDLDERIARRTQAMFEAGVVDEVARLGPLSATAEKTIGLREIRALLSGETDEATCREAIRLATRRYAKRQENWFKREPVFVRFALDRDEPPEITAERIARHFGEGRLS
ncbi:MAG TPA: tRNA (adenosine(37)-N6)-dimethylallyltransferase MiaA [Bacteroidia bacterium]|nr:tRNA (adenosine(37)-N6)-dimethylallyltransferase MiaA [Bacteroidia bacterium]